MSDIFKKWVSSSTIRIEHKRHVTMCQTYSSGKRLRGSTEPERILTLRKHLQRNTDFFENCIPLKIISERNCKIPFSDKGIAKSIF